jgi:hypothetical protein
LEANNRLKGPDMLGIILVAILVILLVGGLPSLGYQPYGYYPSSGARPAGRDRPRARFDGADISDHWPSDHLQR